MSDPGQQSGVVDFIAVEMEDRQNSAVANRVEELTDMPRCRQRAGFRLAIAHDGGNNQFWIIESGPAGVRQHVAQFTAFVYGAGRLGRAMTPDPAGKRELLEKFAQPSLVFALIRIDFRIRTLKIPRRQNSRRTVPGAGHEDHVEVEFPDETVQVEVRERQSGARPPMAQKPVLDVLRLERLFQKRIVLKINHAERQVVTRSPISVGPL